MKKNYGFTMAEVLITLGVIGVVAAITMPILISKYQKMVWVDQLKANYSLLNQGFQKMMADDGVDNLADTEVWKPIVYNDRDCSASTLTDSCDEFYSNLKNYFEIISIEHNVSKNYRKNGISDNTLTRTGTVLTLSNGAQIFDSSFYRNGYVYITIDINGDKKPNTNGRDIFHFRNGSNMQPTGIFLGNGHCDGEYSCWKTSPTYISNGCDKNYTGSWNGCAGRIIEEGWKMNY